MDDHKIYLHFTGYHSVAYASDILTRYHIDNRIVKAPVTKNNSCAFAVLIDENDKEMSVYLLERANIKVSC